MRTRIAAVVMFVVLLATVGAYAQEAPSSEASPGREGLPSQGPGIQRLKTALGLTDDQVTQIRPMVRDLQMRAVELQVAMRTRVQAVLTAQQRSRLEEMQRESMRTGEPMSRHDIIRELNLTPAQLEQIRAIRDEHRPKVEAAWQGFVTQVKGVLTPEQQTRFDQYMEQHRPDRVISTPRPTSPPADGSPAPVH